MSKSGVQHTTDGAVAVIQVDCPPVNPLSNAVLAQLIEAIVAALPAGLELERRELVAALASADAGEGIAAFLDKREAEFVHG